MSAMDAGIWASGASVPFKRMRMRVPAFSHRGHSTGFLKKVTGWAEWSKALGYAKAIDGKDETCLVK